MDYQSNKGGIQINGDPQETGLIRERAGVRLPLERHEPTEVQEPVKILERTNVVEPKSQDYFPAKRNFYQPRFSPQEMQILRAYDATFGFFGRR